MENKRKIKKILEQIKIILNTLFIKKNKKFLVSDIINIKNSDFQLILGFYKKSHKVISFYIDKEVMENVFTGYEYYIKKSIIFKKRGK